MRAEQGLFNIYKVGGGGETSRILKNDGRRFLRLCQAKFSVTYAHEFRHIIKRTYPDVHGVNDGPMRAIGKPFGQGCHRRI